MKADVRLLTTEIRQQLVRLNEDHQEWPDDLAGMCAIGAHLLTEKLHEAGLKTAEFCLAGCGGHCFTLIDGYIADATATQFGEDPVCVVPYKPKGLPWYWTVGQKTANLEEADSFVRGWPVLQRPEAIAQLLRLV